ncbi:MAG: [FeFe] hydrogenase H-cluster maturation GTPase HydF [Bacteroidales bacterium]|jgi:[FeFe] hydrogenase H-cluster maturation GTPase HydF|nr:[FeFe] hydrogenase H-cluster maturation GTPase HydF [Bacteroidales bacterium]
MKTKRIFVGIFGRSNKGKSSLINAIANQDVAIVSQNAGTTTDPVKKSIEIFGIGPVVFVDTAGIDDTTDLGEKRIAKTKQILQGVDVAIILIADNQFGDYEQNIIDKTREYDIPFLIVHNKSDIMPLDHELRAELSTFQIPIIETDSINRTGIDLLINALVQITPPTVYAASTLIGDIISEGDFVALVMPQDSEAPEGRLILPEVQLIRDVLDNYAFAIGMQPQQLSNYLKYQTPKLVITDSQVFKHVAEIVPRQIPITSFSIILARSKGNFENYLKGTPFISQLKDGDKVLTLESCTHPTSCEDIGRHKLPDLIRQFTGKQIDFEMVSSLSPLPDNLQDYAMAIQCGACMVTAKQVSLRIRELTRKNIPVSNYGMSLAYLNGIFERAVEIFR